MVRTPKIKEPKKIPSYKINELLPCTEAECKRWIKNGNLIPYEYRDFNKYGTILKVPYFDPEYLQTITKEIVDSWRLKDKEIEANNRIIGAIIAKQTRKNNSEIIKKFNIEYADLLESWEKEGDLYYLAYRLAYWTVWVSRWAKTYQMSNRSVMSLKKHDLYDLKNKSINLLYESGLSSLAFYIPEKPDKIWIRMCEKHWDELHYIDGEIAQRCKDCVCNINKNYYSLFYQELFDIHSGIKFSFHTPYPIGSKFFPPWKPLNKVAHEENEEGLFRFGRAVYEDEKIIYSNKKVLLEFNKAYEGLLIHLKSKNISNIYLVKGV